MIVDGFEGGSGVLSVAMGLGLWHHAIPALQVQFKSGREIPEKLVGLNTLSRFPEKPRSKRVPFVGVDEGDVGCVLPGFSQLCLGYVTRRALLSKIAVKSSGNSGVRIVAGTAGSFGESERSESLLGSSVVAGSSAGGLFWQPFWDNGGNLEADVLGFSGGGGDSGVGHGNGGKGGGESSGSGGSGSGRFDSWGEEALVSTVVEKKESVDEEQASEEAPTMKSSEFRAPVRASLSSTAGDALDGVASRGDPLLGRTKRPGAAEETAPGVTSKTPGKSWSWTAKLSRLRRNFRAFLLLAVAVTENDPARTHSLGNEMLAVCLIFSLTCNLSTCGDRSGWPC